MSYFRRYWYRIGLVLATILAAAIAVGYWDISSFRTLLCISFISLLIHQFEEYQLPGYFPRMINTVMFKSTRPDRYPLNANTAWIINVWLGWPLYILAIVFADKAIWLATATIMVSAGNVIAHVLLFNIKGRTLYNPGMASALLLFLPMVIYFFIFLVQHQLWSIDSFLVGLALGAAINYFGVLKPITLLSNKNTPYVFKPFR